MVKRYLLSALLVLLSIFSDKALAQSGELPQVLYIASTLPDSLTENANSVIRYSMENDEVTRPGKMTSKYHNIITILNEKADKEATMQFYYNKYISYSNIVMRVYDADGKLIQKYHKGDMHDFAAISNTDLAVDGRVLYLKHSVATYPTTIETEYEVDISSYFDLGAWEIQGNRQSVENAHYSFSIDTNAGFRYLNENTSITPVKNVIDGKSHYTWFIKNLKAVKLEEGAEDWRVLPHVYFAANKFSVDGYPGDISTWKNYGVWLKSLHVDVNSLSPEREAEIRKMTDSLKTDKDKARFLYKYLQQSMRYVSIQLGIGGWKPLSATFVDQKKYGDCKALSNYMSALLKAVNIKSYCAVINAEANKEPADISFPFNHFNHEILCIPFKGDTTWLECTSATQPFGKLGTFTENRRALLITEDGGKLVNTPRSTMADNQFNSDVLLTLDADGGAKATVKVFATGGYRSQLLQFSYRNIDEQKEQIIHWLNIKQPMAFDFTPAGDKNGTKEVDMALQYDKFCDIIAGDKRFYKPQVFDLFAYTLPPNDHRQSDYYFEHPMQKSCRTTIELPAGFEVETLPANRSLKFTYGSFDVQYTYDAAKNQVIGIAKFNLTNHVIPAQKYAEMQEYLDAVSNAQNKKLVIRRKA